MTSVLSQAEKDKAFESREVKDPALNGILNATLDLLRDSPLGRRILTGANYKDVIGEQAYDAARENHTFAVEKAYVGIAGKVKGGHCGLISAKDGDPTYENARGEVYINADFIKNTADALGAENASLYLTNLVAHEFLHGNQRTKMPTEPEDSRSRPAGQPFKRNSMTYEESILAESAAMAGGLTVLMSMSPNETVKNYALEDLRRKGNLSQETFGEIKGFFDKIPESEAEKQAAARKMFSLFVKGQTEYYCQQEGISVDFNKSLPAVKAVYQPSVFGKPEGFVAAVPSLSAENKVKLTASLSEGKRLLMQKLNAVGKKRAAESAIVAKTAKQR